MGLLDPHRRLVGVSLKMYFDLQQTTKYIESCIPLQHLLADSDSLEFFIIPDLLSLTSAASILKAAPSIHLGAPDCFWEDRGAYTGEVSPRCLRDLGVSLVELGHAERRRIFGETDEHIGMKARAVERNNMTPLVCIGERLRGTVQTAVDECRIQVQAVLRATSGVIVFAYEPVWAIGQEESANAEYVVAVTTLIRQICTESGRTVKIIYGGSAGVGTFTPMMAGIDGLFLGRFAQDVENLERIIEEIAKCDS